MSLRDDLDTAGDIADILAYHQRAEMLAAQTAQLAALRDLRDQGKVQALRVQREKTLQDTLFALRRSLPALAGAVDQTPQKVASDIVLAEQTLLLVRPEAFTSLEWKELAVKVSEDLKQITDALQAKHGEIIVQELTELREAVRAVAADERAQAFRAKQEYDEAVQRRQAKDFKKTTIIVAIIAGIAVLFLLISVLAS